MNNCHYQTCIGQSAQMLLLSAMLMILTGCDQRAPESASVELSGPLSNEEVPTDDPLAKSDPSPGTAPKIETEKVVVNVSDFLDAAFDAKTEAVRQAIQAGVDVNATDQQQRTALLLAAFNGHTSVVKLLLDQGALLGHRDAMGRSALMFAATGANAETVALLLEAGAEINAVDAGEGFTALMHAAAEGQVEVVQILLEHKADPAIRDADGDTARDFAMQNSHTEIVDLLTK